MNHSLEEINRGFGVFSEGRFLEFFSRTVTRKLNETLDLHLHHEKVITRDDLRAPLRLRRFSEVDPDKLHFVLSEMVSCYSVDWPNGAAQMRISEEGPDIAYICVLYLYCRARMSKFNGLSNSTNACATLTDVCLNQRFEMNFQCARFCLWLAEQCETPESAVLQAELLGTGSMVFANAWGMIVGVTDESVNRALHRQRQLRLSHCFDSRWNLWRAVSELLFSQDGLVESARQKIASALQ